MTIALQQSGTQTLGTNAPNAALIRATKRRLVNAFWWKLLFTRLPKLNVGEDSRVLEIYTTDLHNRTFKTSELQVCSVSIRRLGPYEENDQILAPELQLSELKPRNPTLKA